MEEPVIGSRIPVLEYRVGESKAVGAGVVFPVERVAHRVRVDIVHGALVVEDLLRRVEREEIQSGTPRVHEGPTRRQAVQETGSVRTGRRSSQPDLLGHHIAIMHDPPAIRDQT